MRRAASGTPALHVAATVEMVDVGCPVDVAVLDEVQVRRHPPLLQSWRRAPLLLCPRRSLGMSHGAGHGRACSWGCRLPRCTRVGTPQRCLSLDASVPSRETRSRCVVPPLLSQTKSVLYARDPHPTPTPSPARFFLRQVRTYKRLSPLTVAPSPVVSLRDVRGGDCVVVFSRARLFEVKASVEALTGLTTAVVYGALPPAVRRAQARLFNGESAGVGGDNAGEDDTRADVLVATDAVGMGLNLRIKRIVFGSLAKYDGVEHRPLTISEMKQIGGRAGRYGSEYPVGEVTAIAPSVNALKTLRRALDSPTPPVERAGMFPLLEQLERYAAGLSGRRSDRAHWVGDADESARNRSTLPQAGGEGIKQVPSALTGPDGAIHTSAAASPACSSSAAAYQEDDDVEAMLARRFSNAEPELHVYPAVDVVTPTAVPEDVDAMLVGRLAPELADNTAEATTSSSSSASDSVIGAANESGRTRIASIDDISDDDAAFYDSRLVSTVDPQTRQRANAALALQPFSSIAEQFFDVAEVSDSDWLVLSCFRAATLLALASLAGHGFDPLLPVRPI